VPETPINCGDHICVSLDLEDTGGELHWRWEGEVERSISQRWSLDSRGELREAAPPPARQDAEQALLAGISAVSEGGYEQAVQHLERATMDLDPRDPRCATAYANLGLALLHTNQPPFAAQALLRAREPGTPNSDIDKLLHAALEAAGRTGRPESQPEKD
jgi:hypothetical protein